MLSPKIKRPRRTRLFVGIAVVLVAVGVLLWLGFGRGVVYYYSVSELKAIGAVQHVRVSGELVGGSLLDEAAATFTFTLQDRDVGADAVTVLYEGALPDLFKNEAGVHIVAEGAYDGNGVFSAETLITKCPSKYEAEQ